MPDLLQKQVLHEHISCELLLTTKCNMHCTYCIARDLPQAVMRREVGQKAIRTFLCLGAGAKSIDITFTGGEPLLEFNLLKSLTLYSERCAQAVGMEPHFILKTNGTILNFRIIKFLQIHCFKVVVSVDGIAETHDGCRKDALGFGTYDIVSNNITRILQNKIYCSASLTVHPQAVKMVLENVHHLSDLGFEYIDVAPVYGTVTWTKADSLNFVEALLDVAKYMREVRCVGRKLEVGPVYRDSKHVGEVLSGNWGCNAALSNLAFLPNGEIAGCSALAMLVPRFPELVIGNVSEGLFEQAVDRMVNLAQAGIQNRLSCNQCQTAPNCAGGCLAINYSENNTAFSPPEYYCKTISAIPIAWQIAWGK